MEILDILQTVLIQFGGGDGTLESSLLRHILASFMWLMTFAIARLIAPVHKIVFDTWFLRAVVFALFVELSILMVKMWSLNAQNTNTGGSGSFQWQAWEPVFTGLFVLSFFYLSLGMIRLIGPAEIRDKLFRSFLVGSVCIVTIVAFVEMHWIAVTHNSATPEYLKSVDAAVLIGVCVLVLCSATWQLFTLRSESTISRIAWVPIGLYLVAHVLMFIASATNTNADYSWLFPISGNLILWTIPWFGYLYLQNLRDQHQHLTHQLQQAEHFGSVERLAAGVAHDFNNHLQSILGFAELGLMQAENVSKRDTQNTGEAQSTDAARGNNQLQFENIIKSVHRAGMLVCQLMSFKADGHETDISIMSLSALLEELDPRICGLLGSGVTVRNQLDASADLVCANRSMLEQAIVNVVVNARDAMPLGGTLTIDSRALNADSDGKQRPMIRLNITDTGKGTTLIIDLPAAECCDVVASSDMDEVESIERFKGTEHILLAEDEAGLRHITSMQLKRAGYEVTTVCDGEEAIEILQTDWTRFNLLLLDVCMPRKDGYTVFEEAQQFCPELPVVFFTANLGEQASSAKYRPKLIKPVGHMDLLSFVRQALDQNQHEYRSRPVERMTSLIE